jgi:hypothetical protein
MRKSMAEVGTIPKTIPRQTRTMRLGTARARLNCLWDSNWISKDHA